MRSDGKFLPLSLDRDTIVFPGFDGGAEWGGAAADPNTGVNVYWTGATSSTGNWYSFGGTSAGAPQWAALIAIANQGRAIARPLGHSFQDTAIFSSLIAAKSVTSPPTRLEA